MWLFLLALAAALFIASPPTQSQTLTDAIADGTPLIDMRLRHETVDQSDKSKDATATTLRARLGYETGRYRGLSGLLEFDLVQHFGPKNYNDTINGLPSYPVIADPDMATLNRLQLSYDWRLAAAPDAPADVRFILGRQAIIISDLRFVGNSAWRQHEQTYDAILIEDTSLPGTTLTYAYVTRVNRPSGPQTATGHFDSDSHFFDAVYAGVPGLKVEGFVYLFDFANAPTLSLANYGVRAEGGFEIGTGITASFSGTVARQRNRANNPLAIDLGDYRAEGGLGFGGATGLIGYEVLEGNGITGFQTPLGTGHLFQGWAETFTNKPLNGVKDFYAKASYGFPAAPLFMRITPAIAYHSFSAGHVNADYGSEWDTMLEAQVDRRLTLDIAYADYRGAGPFPSKRDFWAYATYRY